MKIGIDIGSTKSGHAIRGVGFYTKNLAEALGKNIDQIDTNDVDLSQYDLVHIPHFNPFVNTFPKGIDNTKYIVTIHDLIPLIYPKHYPPGIKGRIRFISQKNKAKNAKLIITDTESSKKDIIRFLGVAPERIHVVYLAPQGGLKKLDKKSLEKVREKYNLPEKFVLYIGDINYNKNITNLIKACDYAKLPLVIIGKQAADLEDLGEDLRNLRGPMDWIRYILGKPHPELAHYKNIYKAFKKNKSVYRVGFVPPEDFSAITQLASVYCQPSYYEGFGLPVLEAFSMELPVVASKTQALVEVGGDACLYADPHNYKDMGDKLKKVVNDSKLKSALIEKGNKRLKQFSWIKAAKETLNVYKLA